MKEDKVKKDKKRKSNKKEKISKKEKKEKSVRREKKGKKHRERILSPSRSTSSSDSVCSSRQGRDDNRQREFITSNRRSSGSSNKVVESDRRIQLYHLLSFIMIAKSPLFTHEIHMIIKALDDGEYVDIEGETTEYSFLSDPQNKSLVLQLMHCLPVLHKVNHGWYKDSATTDVKGYVTNSLVSINVVRPLGQQLSMSESMASTQILSKLRLFMSRYPSLIVELLPIFGSLHEGNAVQLDDIEDEDVREELGGMFRALQLQLDAEEGYSLPNSSRQTLIREVLDHIMYMLQSYETSYGVVTSLLTTTRTSRADASCNAEAIVVASASAHSNRHGSSHINHRYDHDLGSSHEGRDHSDEGEGVHEQPNPLKRKLLMGPAMPTRDQIEEAHQLLLHAPRSRDVDSEDDDEYGPAMEDPLSMRHSQAVISSLPLGFVGLEDAVVLAIDMNSRTSNGLNSVLVESSSDQPPSSTVQQAREEWILDPGESKALSGMLSGAAAMTNRKFQTGKQAKKRAEHMSIQNEFLRQQQQSEGGVLRQKEDPSSCVEQGQMKASSGEEVSTRGPSLMEMHLQSKHSKQPETFGGRVPFNREKVCNSSVVDWLVGLNEWMYV